MVNLYSLYLEVHHRKKYFKCLGLDKTVVLEITSNTWKTLVYQMLQSVCSYLLCLQKNQSSGKKYCLPLKLKFSKHRPSGPILSISRNVRVSVRVFTFKVPFKRLFAPFFPKSDVQKI